MKAKIDQLLSKIPKRGYIPVTLLLAGILLCGRGFNTGNAFMCIGGFILAHWVWNRE